MCYNCGCANPDDDMGHPDNITTSTLSQLSKHWNISVDETKKRLIDMIENIKFDEDHVVKMFEAAARAWGQSTDEAKKNTKELLKSEVEKS